VIVSGGTMKAFTGRRFDGALLLSYPCRVCEPVPPTDATHNPRLAQEQLVGQRLPEVAIGRWRIPGGGRVYDGRLLSTGQYVEVKTTTRGIVYLNAHIRRQIAFDAAQGTKPLWIFVGGSPSRGLQVELNKAGIPWQILEP